MVVETSHSDTSVCFGQTLTAVDVTKDTPAELKATVPDTTPGSGVARRSR